MVRKSKGKGPASAAGAGSSAQGLATQMASMEVNICYKPRIGQRFRIPPTTFQDASQDSGPMTDRFPDAQDWRTQWLYATKVGDRNGCFGLKFDDDDKP